MVLLKWAPIIALLCKYLCVLILFIWITIHVCCCYYPCIVLFSGEKKSFLPVMFLAVCNHHRLISSPSSSFTIIIIYYTYFIILNSVAALRAHILTHDMVFTIPSLWFRAFNLLVANIDCNKQLRTTKTVHTLNEEKKWILKE